MIFPYWYLIHPADFHIFQSGRSTNNQFSRGSYAERWTFPAHILRFETASDIVGEGCGAF